MNPEIRNNNGSLGSGYGLPPSKDFRPNKKRNRPR